MYLYVNFEFINMILNILVGNLEDVWIYLINVCILIKLMKFLGFIIREREKKRERELLYKIRFNDFLIVNKLKCGDYYFYCKLIFYVLCIFRLFLWYIF